MYTSFQNTLKMPDFMTIDNFMNVLLMTFITVIIFIILSTTLIETGLSLQQTRVNNLETIDSLTSIRSSSIAQSVDFLSVPFLTTTLSSYTRPKVKRTLGKKSSTLAKNKTTSKPSSTKVVINTIKKHTDVTKPKKGSGKTSKDK